MNVQLSYQTTIDIFCGVFNRLCKRMETFLYMVIKAGNQRNENVIP